MTESTAKLRSGRARALRQRMYLSIISPCQARVRWSVPLGAKYRKAVNSGSSGSGGALPRSPLRTGHARFPGSSAQASLKGSLPGRRAGPLPVPRRRRQLARMRWCAAGWAAGGAVLEDER